MVRSNRKPTISPPMTAAESEAPAEGKCVRARPDDGNSATTGDGETEMQRRLTDLFETHAHEWHGLALHLLQGRHDDAAEVVQAAFLRCWQRFEQLHQVANLRGYIATTIANLARDEYRRQERRPTVELGTDQLARDGRRPDAHPPAVPEALEREEMLTQVQTAIQSLREEEREVFLLRQNAEMSYAEIATALGIAEGTVKTRMRLALERLRQQVRS